MAAGGVARQHAPPPIAAAPLSAVSGATLSLPQLTAYSNPNGASGNANATQFMAQGTGSVLDLPGLSTLGVLQSPWGVVADTGGHVNLPGFTTIDGTGKTQFVSFKAMGPGAVLSLPNL